MRTTNRSIGCLVALAAAGCPFAVRAVPPVPPEGVAAMAPARAVPITHRAIPGFGPSVATAALAATRGGSNVTQDIHITGSVIGNSTENVGTGMNWIGGGAFDNAAGLPMVIQNSGNSVLIQNATVLNVQLQP